jgi:hypothetical protein
MRLFDGVKLALVAVLFCLLWIYSGAAYAGGRRSQSAEFAPPVFVQPTYAAPLYAQPPTLPPPVWSAVKPAGNCTLCADCKCAPGACAVGGCPSVQAVVSPGYARPPAQPGPVYYYPPPSYQPAPQYVYPAGYTPSYGQPLGNCTGFR